MGDIMVLTPNTIHILVHLRAHLRRRMWWVRRSKGRGSHWWQQGQSARWIQNTSQSKRSQLTEKTFEHWKHTKPSLNSENEMCIYTSNFRPTSSGLTACAHCCPHMAESGDFNNVYISIYFANNTFCSVFVYFNPAKTLFRGYDHCIMFEL